MAGHESGRVRSRMWDSEKVNFVEPEGKVGSRGWLILKHV